ncbi:type IV toxin-antitoxin system AbiEi family antitoxin [Mycolicibacterium arenosum]|uniref:AbiEi antitoxin C-terminal domain-containing protein n=1 Tax=Mycolicibacterium arenosum TaxID=2952157 RepID=A0ABT1M0C8_9MYCO|nr:type IV toxin-antitoxin system AbiEi family antitoxin [Mycolicibacterium sp. CAU 1645]MCP9271892.1 hypothetical protein [Mycolicibacterium sp. CAU 1645]
MDEASYGSDLLGGGLTPGQLRWRYEKVLPGVYVPRGAETSVALSAHAAWLSTDRTGIIADHRRRRRTVVVREERIDWDEVCMVGELAVTTPARTVLDLARHLPRLEAVGHLDALAAATGITAADVAVLVDRYRGARGMKRARIALALMDGGAQSPKETWLRLLVVDAGYPRPTTQIRVTDGCTNAFVDLGWEEPRIGLDYDGEHHQTKRDQFVHDIGRAELIDSCDWLDLHVVKEHTPAFILHRLGEACERRGWIPLARSAPR